MASTGGATEPQPLSGAHNEWVSKRKGTKWEKRVLAISAQRVVTFRPAAFGKITVARDGHYWCLNEIRANMEGLHLIFKHFTFEFVSPHLGIAATTLAGAYQRCVYGLPQERLCVVDAEGDAEDWLAPIAEARRLAESEAACTGRGSGADGGRQEDPGVFRQLFASACANQRARVAPESLQRVVAAAEQHGLLRLRGRAAASMTGSTVLRDRPEEEAAGAGVEACPELGSAGVFAASEAMRFTACVAEVDLTGGSFGDEPCAQLAPALSESRSLRRLRCAGAGLGPQAMAAWARAFVEGDVGQRITELDLSENPLSDQGVHEFLSAISRLRQLRVLGLARVEAGSGATAALFDALSTPSTAPEALQRVDVSGNTAGYDGTAALCRWLTSEASAPLTHLAVARCGLAVDTVFAAWPKLACRLEVLDFTGNVLGRTATAAMVTALLQSAHPRTLHAGAMVTNAVAYEQTATAMGFAPQRYHCELSFAGAGLAARGEAVVSALAAAPTLARLDLHRAKLGPVAVRSLLTALTQPGYFPALQSLDLSYAWPEDAPPKLSDALAYAVRKSRLQSLALCGLRATAQSFDLGPMCEAVASTKFLDSLYLTYNALTEKEAGKLAHALGQASQLRVADVLAGNAASLAAVEQLAHALRDHPAVTFAGCLQVPSSLIDDEAAIASATKALREAETRTRARRSRADAPDTAAVPGAE